MIRQENTTAARERLFKSPQKPRRARGFAGDEEKTSSTDR
jgi:hypothetical protein